MKLSFILPILAVVLSGNVAAAELACPDLAAAVQVAPCPSEEELRYTFSGFCGDNARMYAKDTDTCVSYENYRKAKNIALWESANGEFQAYLSCDLSLAAVRTAKAQRIIVGKAGKLTRVACEYGQGIVFAHRTHAACKVEGDGGCSGPACKASCD
jgi:hypothetical protein